MPRLTSSAENSDSRSERVAGVRRFLGGGQPRGALIMLRTFLTAASVAVELAIATAPCASADSQPTLGRVWAPNQEGYATVRPVKVFNGGDPTGMIWNITWSSWGGAQATGTGTANWEPPGATVAEAVSQPATIVA